MELPFLREFVPASCPMVRPVLPLPGQPADSVWPLTLAHFFALLWSSHYILDHWPGLLPDVTFHLDLVALYFT